MNPYRPTSQFAYRVGQGLAVLAIVFVVVVMVRLILWAAGA
jgi:hypothetical protein